MEGSQTILVIFAAIVYVSARRVYNMHHGSRFSMERTIAYVAIYAGIGLVFSAMSFYEGVSLIFAPLYALVMVGAGVASYVYSDRRITFWKSSDGSTYFKGGVVIYFVYLAGLMARLAIDYIAIGPNVFSFSPGLALSGVPLYATIATDLLLMLGNGLLVGRNLRVLKRYRRIERGEDAIPDTPSPLGSEAGSAGWSSLRLVQQVVK
jgi:hypothetical protein